MTRRPEDEPHKFVPNGRDAPMNWCLVCGEHERFYLHQANQPERTNR